MIGLAIIIFNDGFSQDWKQWTPSDTTWHMAIFPEAAMSPDSTEYCELTYINPSNTLERIVEQRYRNGSLRGYEISYNHGTKLQSGLLRSYYPGVNESDTGQIRHTHIVYNLQYDDTLQSWWPNGTTRTLEVYDRGRRLSGKSFNDQGEELAYIPYEKFPGFPGGDQQLMSYLSNNITYPKKLRNQNITGNVLATFRVNEDGSISNVEILESPHKLFSEEVVRLINSMPAWIPGTQEGKPVRVEYRLPIRFSLP